MHTATFLSAASALFAVASARAHPPTPVLAARQSVVTPPPCEAINPPPSAAETEARFDEFAEAFLVEQNLTHAFEFIASSYINHNPYVSANGSAAALDALGPIWGTIDIEVLRTKYTDPQGWLNYNASGVGIVVDRFRWEAGCIVEHWDAGEVFPGDASNSTSSVSSSNNGSGATNSSTTPVVPVSGAKRSVVATTTQIVVTGAFAFSFLSYI